MKRKLLGLIWIVLVCAIPILSHAQVPERVNYQGRLVDGGGLVNGNREIVLRLEDTGGTELYAETQ